MAKAIDPVDIKAAIKNGQLKVKVVQEKDYYRGETNYRIYIQDEDERDTVLIKEFDSVWRD